MSEDITSNPDPSDEGTGKSDAPDGEKKKSDTVSRTELEAKIRERDTEKDKRRKIEKDFDTYKSESTERLTALEAQLQEFSTAKTSAEEEAAKKSGDIDKLQRTWETQRADLQKLIDAEKSARSKDIDDWRSKHDSMSKRYYENLVEKRLLEELAQVSTNATAELVFFKSDFEFEAIEDDDGRFQGVKAKDSDKTIAQLHKEVCEKYGLPFEKNDRANGSGAQQPNGADSGKFAAKLPSGFQNWPKDKQRTWFAENPGFKLTV